MIPVEAVEAARAVAFERYGTKPDAVYIRTLLTAAAPILMAAAWDECESATYEIRLDPDTLRHWEPYKVNPYRPTP